MFTTEEEEEPDIQTGCNAFDNPLRTNSGGELTLSVIHWLSCRLLAGVPAGWLLCLLTGLAGLLPGWLAGRLAC